MIRVILVMNNLTLQRYAAFRQIESVELNNPEYGDHNIKLFYTIERVFL